MGVIAENQLLTIIYVPCVFGHSYRLIKRRVIWLIGNWVTVKLSIPARPVVYSAILSLLDEGEDVVVRMESALTLKAGRLIIIIGNKRLIDHALCK